MGYDHIKRPEEYHAWLEKRRQRARDWNKNNREPMAKRRKNYLLSMRTDVINAYGGKCSCCGEKEFAFLTIDHINGNGKQDRIERKGVYGVYRWLQKQGYPKDNYRCLCMNCNWAVRNKGICPHKLRR